ncbi:MAG: DUF3108 domain-containing protein [Bdellovibrionota bacterium]
MQDTKQGPSEQDNEFEKVVRVQDIKESKKSSEPVEQVTLPIAQPEPKKSAQVKSSPKDVKAPVKPIEIKPVVKTSTREPKIEDSVGFNGRRPIEDPYRAGEKVVLTAKYLNVEAGDITLEVLPFKKVNDRKAYHLRMNIQTNKTFNMFYAVNNTSETYLDYDTMVPQTFTYDAKESSRIREYKIFFDTKKQEATQWRREVHKKKGESKKKITWKIEPYSQNILSALFYLRAFQLEPGKKYSYRVADEGKNYVFTFHVLRREKLETSKGVLNTLVIRPDYQIDGTFKPSGQNTIWVTDDNRKFIVQIAAKVKIGTFMLKLKSIEGPK